MKNMSSPVIVVKKIRKVSMSVISRHYSTGNVIPSKGFPSTVDNDDNRLIKLHRLRLR